MYATGDKDILLVNSKKCAPAGTRHNATITIANRRRDLSSTAFSRTNEKTAKPIDSVRFGSKADLRLSVGDVRFTPKSGHSTDSFGMSPLCHKRTNALAYYWIASSARASSVRGTSRLATLTFPTLLKLPATCDLLRKQRVPEDAAVRWRKIELSCQKPGLQRLEFIERTGICGPCWRLRSVWVAGLSELGPVVHHRARQLTLIRAQLRWR